MPAQTQQQSISLLSGTQHETINGHTGRGHALSKSRPPGTSNRHRIFGSLEARRAAFCTAKWRRQQAAAASQLASRSKVVSSQHFRAAARCERSIKVLNRSHTWCAARKQGTRRATHKLQQKQTSSTVHISCSATSTQPIEQVTACGCDCNSSSANSTRPRNQFARPMQCLRQAHHARTVKWKAPLCVRACMASLGQRNCKAPCQAHTCACQMHPPASTCWHGTFSQTIQKPERCTLLHNAHASNMPSLLKL